MHVPTYLHFFKGLKSFIISVISHKFYQFVCGYGHSPLFQIAVNGVHFTEFNHRMPMENLKYLVIKGSQLEIKSIKYEGGYVSTCHMIVKKTGD